MNFLLLAVVAVTLNALQTMPAEGAMEVAEVRACNIELTPLGREVRWGGAIPYDLVTDSRGSVVKLSRREDDPRSTLSGFVRIEQFEGCVEGWRFGAGGNYEVLLVIGTMANRWVIDVRRDSRRFRMTIPTKTEARPP